MAKDNLDIVVGDITTHAADAIVNAANPELLAGGGVCGAIFRAAGAQELAAACRDIGGCPTGSAVITPAFGIHSARYIIHAVGPVYDQHTPERARELLRSAYSSAISVAAQNDCSSVAFPAISTGIYGYPLDDACREAVDVCALEASRNGLAITLVAFDDATAACLRQHRDVA